MSLDYLHIEWQTVPVISALDPGDVHLWMCDLELYKREADDPTSLLSPGEIQQFRRLIDPLKSTDRMASRGFLRRILEEYTGISGREVVLKTLPGGKPVLDPAQNFGGIEFNLSHTCSTAVIAICIGRRAGVDIENVVPIADIGHIRSALPEFPQESDDPRALLAAWTRHEAYLKAIGAGWRGAKMQMPSSDWLVCNFSPDDNIIGGLAVEGIIQPEAITGYQFQRQS